MKKFIPRQKLSKKARRELDSKARVLWQFSPVTRCPQAPGAYNRNREHRQLREITREALEPL